MVEDPHPAHRDSDARRNCLHREDGGLRLFAFEIFAALKQDPPDGLLVEPGHAGPFAGAVVPAHRHQDGAPAGPP